MTPHTQQRDTRWFSVLLTVAAVVAAARMISLPVSVQRQAFCAPAAHLAGLLSGAPCVPDGEDCRLTGAGLDLVVVPDCAATDYFCIMAGFLSLLMSRRGWRWPAQFAILPIAWLITITVNAFRLTACWQTDRLTHTVLPAPFWPAIHMAVGVVTFLMGMIVVTAWLVRRPAGGRYE